MATMGSGGDGSGRAVLPASSMPFHRTWVLICCAIAGAAWLCAHLSGWCPRRWAGEMQ